MAHTPGPWAYELEYGPNITESPRITTVARCANYVIGLPSEYPGGNYRDGDPCGDEESDARLIAAAPDLLEALQSVWLWMENQADAQSKGGHATFDLMALREQRDIARAAIAKATGEQ